MIPKQKAEEIFKEYWLYLRANLMHDEEAMEDAKVCSLLAIDIFIPYIRETHKHPYYKEDITEYTKEFWEKVKQEIKKL